MCVQVFQCKNWLQFQRVLKGIFWVQKKLVFSILGFFQKDIFIWNLPWRVLDDVSTNGHDWKIIWVFHLKHNFFKCTSMYHFYLKIHYSLWKSRFFPKLINFLDDNFPLTMFSFFLKLPFCYSVFLCITHTRTKRATTSQ